MLEAIVLPNGTVGDVKVVQSLDTRFGLDNQAVKAAKQWAFRPGTKDGEPVAVRVFIELTFSLRSQR
jgi:protein TonB